MRTKPPLDLSGLGYEDWDSSPTRQRCWSGHDGSISVSVELIDSSKSSGTLDTPAFHDKVFTWRPEGIWQGPWSKRGTPRTMSENPAGTKFTSRRYITKGCPPCYENGFASSGYRRNACFSSSSYHEIASEKTQSLTHQSPLHLILSSSNNCHIYYRLTGQNKEDNPKTCPHEDKMAGMCVDRTGSTSKIRLEKRTIRGDEGL